MLCGYHPCLLPPLSCDEIHTKNTRVYKPCKTLGQYTLLPRVHHFCVLQQKNGVQNGVLIVAGHSDNWHMPIIMVYKMVYKWYSFTTCSNTHMVYHKTAKVHHFSTAKNHSRRQPTPLPHHNPKVNPWQTKSHGVSRAGARTRTTCWKWCTFMYSTCTKAL